MTTLLGAGIFVGLTVLMLLCVVLWVSNIEGRVEHAHAYLDHLEARIFNLEINS